MWLPSKSRRAQKRVSRTDTTPAPVGGLNVRDSISAMPPTDAIVLRNFFPTPYGCLVRKGYTEHATELPGPVETLMSYNSRSGTNVLLAACDGEIYDVSAAGDYSAATPKYTGKTNDRWQWVNFSNSGGSHLIAFNGADDGIWFNGTTYDDLIAGDGVATGTYSGVDPADVISCCVHQRRVWLVPVGSTTCYYLPVDAIFGTVVAFDFGPLMSRGGFVVSQYTWTIDSGTGSDDLLVTLTSEGQVIVFKGTNPASAATWALVGIYDQGKPVGNRCGIKYAGDLAYMNSFGLSSLTQSLVSTKVENTPDTAYTDKIQFLVSDLISVYGSLFGWQILVYPTANMLILNVPLSATSSIQMAMNTITRAWGQFENLNALCWELHYEAPFFGTADGIVYRFWEGNRDAADSAGNGGIKVAYEGQTAFNYFKSPGALKHFKMSRATFIGNGSPGAYFAVNTDFDFGTVLGSALSPSSASGIWNVSQWNQGLWAGSDTTFKPWGSVEGLGYAGSLRVKGEATGEALWTTTDWVYEPGGVI